MSSGFDPALPLHSAQLAALFAHRVAPAWVAEPVAVDVPDPDAIAERAGVDHDEAVRLRTLLDASIAMSFEQERLEDGGVAPVSALDDRFPSGTVSAVFGAVPVTPPPGAAPGVTGVILLPGLAVWRRTPVVGALLFIAGVIATPNGSGVVVLMTDNPNFRGYWYGGNKLFLNAIFFGPVIRPVRPRGGEEEAH